MRCHAWLCCQQGSGEYGNEMQQAVYRLVPGMADDTRGPVTDSVSDAARNAAIDARHGIVIN